MALAWTVRSNIVFECFSLLDLIPLSAILYKQQTMLIVESRKRNSKIELKDCAVWYEFKMKDFI